MRSIRAERRAERGRHPSRLRGPTKAPVGAPARWQERKWLARFIRLAVFAIPIALSFLFALALSSWLPTPEPFLYRLGRWIAIAVLSTGVLMLAQRLTRRLLPLAALMSLTLVFPDDTPSRFGIALRSMSARQLEKRLEQIDEEGLGDTPKEAAETLLELVAALSRHDRLTRGHSERVRAYSIMIGEELELSEAELDQLRWAALLHDVGKLHVSPEILNKPGTLTADEYEQIKQHTVAGQTLVAPLAGWLGEAADAVHQHHERFAGGGYPTGARASELPLVSRIVSVADAFDVMTSARSYKPPTTAQAARAELERCAGAQFDPLVVRAMMNVSLGALWRTMGPMAWVAQSGLFPRPLAQGGTAASAVLAALLALLLTGLAEASRRGESDLTFAEGSTTSVLESADDDDGDGDGGGGGGSGGGGSGGAGDSGGGAAGSGSADDPTGDGRDGSDGSDGSDDNGARTPPTGTSANSSSDPSSSTTEPLSGSYSATPIVVTLPPQLRASSTTAPARPSTATATTVERSTDTTTTAPLVAVTTTQPVIAPPTPTTTAATTTTPSTTTLPTTTTTVTNPPTTTLPPDPNRFVLASPGTGDQASQQLLPLAPDRTAQNDALPNYDTDRNADPGLTLAPGPGTLISTTPGTIQVWQFPASYTTIEGAVAVDLFVAPVEAASGSGLRVSAGLFECDAVRSVCVRVKRDRVDVEGAVGEFAKVTFDLTPNNLPYALPTGLQLELRVAVEAGSATDAWVAYDASGFESQLVVTPVASSASLGVAPGGSGRHDLPAAIVVTLMALLMASGLQQWRIDHGRVRHFAFPTHG